MNASRFVGFFRDEPIEFRIPKGEFGRRWVKELDTSLPLPGLEAGELSAGSRMLLEARALALLRRVA